MFGNVPDVLNRPHRGITMMGLMAPLTLTCFLSLHNLLWIIVAFQHLTHFPIYGYTLSFVLLLHQLIIWLLIPIMFHICSLTLQLLADVNISPDQPGPGSYRTFKMGLLIVLHGYRVGPKQQDQFDLICQSVYS